MNTIVRLYAMLTRISGWIEGWRVALLVRVYGVANNESKPPTDWREREKLPDHNQWPTVKATEDSRLGHSVLLVGAVKVGPVHPVPAPPEFYKENHE